MLIMLTCILAFPIIIYMHISIKIMKLMKKKKINYVFKYKSYEVNTIEKKIH